MTNQEKVEKPRLCRCEHPDKEYAYACLDCWKCRKCQTYGGCENMKKFWEGLFNNGK